MCDNDNVNYFLGTIVLLSICSLAIIGAIFLISDYRKFDDIKKQCESSGYIQNNSIRILCNIEKNNAKS